MILDNFSQRNRPWNVCIVGSGPVGISAALECEKLGLEVIVLESGKRTFDAALTNPSWAEILDPRRHAAMEIAVARAIGGTSWLWGGRCVPFDDVDFAARHYVPNSDWPITHEDVKPYYSAAALYLACGSAVFDSPTKHIRDQGESLRVSHLERWSSESRLALVHGPHLKNSTKITICVNSTVVGLRLSSGGTGLKEAAIATHEGLKTVLVENLIVAAGGIETTRLLLAAQRNQPNAFGGVDGPLGRYYMGHVSGKIATITFDDRKALDDLDFELDSNGTYIRRRFALTQAAQQQNRVLNTAFWPDNPAFSDPEHRSGVLSAVFLALASPTIGRRILPEAIRLAHTGPKPYKIRQHLQNVITDGLFGLRDIADILWHRFLTKPRKPGFLIRNRSGRYGLHYSAEQEPNRESRITLTEQSDHFGLPRVKIDLRFTRNDIESVITSHRALDAELRHSGTAKLQFSYPDEQLFERVDSQASDGFHQVGTTRMGTDPRCSVVDANLKVHGIDNLYVASSSVFPTSGQANSTFLAAALAVRLAHHIASAYLPTAIRMQKSTPNTIGIL